jgi:hypothetical protein
MDADKIGKVSNVIDSVSFTIKSADHINELIKHSNTIITGEFVLHMSRESVTNPLRLGHMYDWNGIGDPQERLWKHRLRGRGSARQLSFEFKASKKSVPVSPVLRSVGVRQNHIFQWKSMVMEMGMPVRISPVLALALVFEAKEVKRGASTTGSGFTDGARVYHRGTIAISKAGPEQAWGAFTSEFNQWFRSGIPDQIIKRNLSAKIGKTIRSSVLQKVRGIASVKSKPKTFTLQPIGLDKSFVSTLNNSLRVNYIASAASRKVLTQDDDL